MNVFSEYNAKDVPTIYRIQCDSVVHSHLLKEVNIYHVIKKQKIHIHLLECVL